MRKRNARTMTPVRRGAMLLAVALFAWSAAAQADPRWRGEWPRTDFAKRTVVLEEIVSGGPPRDGIPAIDRPRFVAAAEAGRWLDPREPVIVFEHRGEVRAYPLQILMFHEIVNDTVGGTPVAITFCPLCNASIVFDRRVGGAVLDFGTTGKLRKSDLVMYDRQTESWWQQFTGQGIVGRHAGATLAQLPAMIAAFADFRSAYPQARVLSRETGFARPYGRNPYRGYDRIGDKPFLFSDPVDPRLPAMERVLGVVRDGRVRIYPFAALAAAPVINDEIGREPVVVFSRAGMLSVLDAEIIGNSRHIPAAAAYKRKVRDRVLSFERRENRIVDRETGSQWDVFGRAVAGPLRGARLQPADSGVHFAFAWLAFNPNSEIYSAADARRR
ncbi:MAG: DUF3179 domain-containing protein [Betaproteobacteria bacterium]|nr:DUF3179 domain-containing protein [Betaproteobacteria bacterium]